MPGSTLESATAEDTRSVSPPGRPRARRGDVLRRVVRRPIGLIGLALVSVAVVTAQFAGRIAPGDPFDTYAGPSLSPPSGAHLMGTDNLGRDLFTAVVHGTRTSMVVVFWVVVISSVIGLLVGSVCGYRGGFVDDVMMRVTEAFQLVPRFFLALLMISFWGRGLDKLILLLGLTSWPFLARIVRAEAIRLRNQTFVESARSVGASSARILARHVVPNLLQPVVVVIALFASRVILIEAGLAFLGLGDPDRISLGYLANNAQEFLRLAWWMAVFPGAAIVVVTLGLNLLADAVNDALRGAR
jgi:peptide/nickel transport system permease protein